MKIKIRKKDLELIKRVQKQERDRMDKACVRMLMNGFKTNYTVIN